MPVCEYRLGTGRHREPLLLPLSVTQSARVCQSVCLSVSLSLCLCVWLSLSLSICLSAWLNDSLLTPKSTTARKLSSNLTPGAKKSLAGEKNLYSHWSEGLKVSSQTYRTNINK